jgi:hypothetical protein
MPNPQERPTLHNILDHAFFTCGVVPKFIPVSTLNPPPKFPAHLATCLTSESRSAATDGQLDGEVLPSTSPNSEPPVPSVSSATSSLAQQEREFQKAVQRCRAALSPLGASATHGCACRWFCGLRCWCRVLCILFPPFGSIIRTIFLRYLFAVSSQHLSVFAGDRATSFFTACNLRSRVGSPRMLA